MQDSGTVRHFQVRFRVCHIERQVCIILLVCRYLSQTNVIRKVGRTCRA